MSGSEKDRPEGGAPAIELVIHNAEPVAPAPPPPEEAPPGGGEDVPPEAARGALPPGCPVIPLGINGDVYFYLDANGQLRTRKDKDHSRLGILSLFGSRQGTLYAFPRTDKSGAVTGWRPERWAEELIAAASAAGVLDVFNRVRGRGGWLGDDGELVFHAGDAIVMGPSPDPEAPAASRAERRVAPGHHGRMIYPAAAQGPKPADGPVPGGDLGPGRELLALLNKWSWRRGEVDAMLLLGWIGAAMLGGALRWRPLVWITGDRGTGKSTLHDLLKLILDDALVGVTDPTAAGIWQKLGHSSHPVAIDEMEAEEDNRRGAAIVKLAREAASGGVVLRGGADHQGAEFTARSCFLFSSILIPPLMGQDVSRMAVLELLPLGEISPPPLSRNRLAGLGAGLRRRLLDGWPQWAARLETWRQAMAAAGHGGRGADQFGTLLACADLLLHDQPPSTDELQGWAGRLTAADVADRTDDQADHERCLAHLLTSVIDVWRGGERQVVGGLVAKAEAGEQEAIAALETFGLKVVRLDRWIDGAGNARAGEAAWWLAVANAHQGLAGLFAGSHWAGKSGASGVWVQALRRVEGAARPVSALRFRGIAARATLLPIDAVMARSSEDLQ